MYISNVIIYFFLNNQHISNDIPFSETPTIFQVISIFLKHPAHLKWCHFVWNTQHISKDIKYFEIAFIFRWILVAFSSDFYSLWQRVLVDWLVDISTPYGLFNDEIWWICNYFNIIVCSINLFINNKFLFINNHWFKPSIISSIYIKWKKNSTQLYCSM